MTDRRNYGTHALHSQKIKLSPKRKLRIRVLSFFLVLLPFLSIFGKLWFVIPAFENIEIYSIYNFFALALSLLLLLLFRQRFPKNVLRIAVVLIAMLLFNFLVTEYASLKWLLNWLGFIVISAVIANSIFSLNEFERFLLQRQCSSLIRFALIVISLIMMETWFTEIDALLGNIVVKPNNVIALLTLHAGIDKQALGIFFGMILAYSFALWGTWSSATRLLLIAALLLSIPALIGIRTLYLGMIVAGAWYFFAKRSSHKELLLVISVSLAAIGLLYLSELLEYAASSYDRINSLKFSMGTLLSNPFGVGNGGYAQFVTDNESAILTQFGSDLMIARDAFWTAPESDLVYFIASWGVLSVFFFGFYGYMLSSGRKLVKMSALEPIEKALILMSWLMIFMGISQDNAGSAIWWVYMAAGYGVLLRHHYARYRYAQYRRAAGSSPA